jgi:hypothetical protein
MSAIPASDISIDIDGTTAWLVDTPGMSVGWELRNRPCDTCDGSGTCFHGGPDVLPRCPDCDGTGRRTFTIELECPICNGKRSEFCGYGDGLPDDNPSCSMGVERVAVHVVEVLPIHDYCTDYKPADHICHAWRDDRWYWHRSERGDRPTEKIITLPDSAAPGMWAVLLAIKPTRKRDDMSTPKITGEETSAIINDLVLISPPPKMTLNLGVTNGRPLMQSAICPTCEVHTMHHVLTPKVGDPFFQCLNYTCQAQWPFE